MPDALLRTTLDNGLRVVVQRVPGTSGVGVAVHYRVGFRTETHSRSGFAHLFEHMMFQGSRNVARGEHFAAVLANGGAVNGNTFQDSTDYHQVFPVAALPRVLELEADRMMALAVTQHNLDVQREVVKEEIRTQVTGKPYGGFPWTILPSVLYDRWENAHNGYGETADLDAATIEDCAAFFDTYYAPGNAVLAVCGDIDPQVTLELVRSRFAHVPARATPQLADISEPVGDRPLHGTCYDTMAPRPALAIGCRLPDAAADFDAYAAYVVLSYLLTSGTQARLRKALAPLGAQVDSSPGFFGPLMAKDPDTFLIVSHHPPGLAEEVTGIVTEQAADLAAGGSNPGEAERAVANAVGNLYQSLDSLTYRVRFLARGTLLWDRPHIADELCRAVAATTADAISAAAATVARPAGRAVLTLLPKGAGE